MGAGSQRNKAHKGSGKSARLRHREARDGTLPTVFKSSARAAQAKADRLNSTKQQREKKRAEVLAQRRKPAPPCVVALLPLSADVDAAQLWAGLLSACQGPATASATAASMDVEPSSLPGSAPPLAMCTTSLAERRRLSFTFLPPPPNREDPLAVVELGRVADVVLVAVPGGDNAAAAVDQQGAMALSVLRALGLPSVVAVVQLPLSEGGKCDMKARSAARKRGAAAFEEQLPGEHKLCIAESAADMQQIMRHLADMTPTVPLWRQQRPSLMVQAAEFCASPDPALGTLLLRGYVRNTGFSVNQAIHIPLIGDFLLDRLRVVEPPAEAVQSARHMEAEGAGLVLECAPDPLQQESLQRENVPDPLAGEQTWPTEGELMEAEAAAKQSNASRKRRLPTGTSDYQAAWILDDEDEGEEDEAREGSDDEEGEGMSAGAHAEPGEEDGLEGGLEADLDTGTEFDIEYEDDESAHIADMLDTIKQRRQAAQDDIQYPDEVEVPPDVAARQRFGKYRGLKSFRTSPWDPKESLPPEYARVFAFERPRRAEKRAKEAAQLAGEAGDSHGVPAGAYVELHVASVPADAAQRVCTQVVALQEAAVPPVTVFGLLQHECKLSVVHFGLRKAAGFPEPIRAKEELLFVTGLRTFPTRPILSSDEHGADKHKMERFLHEGRTTVASIYAPIPYGPLPLLVFKASPAGQLQLAATGTLRGCDPDRVILKKIVLSGYPVKVHKRKAVVRYMFHNPDDVRWFRPVELWTKHGRRGRLQEPVGTHGTMKCIFDGPMRQQDAVCMSLYKRVFPKWPATLDFV